MGPKTIATGALIMGSANASTATTLSQGAFKEVQSLRTGSPADSRGSTGTGVQRTLLVRSTGAAQMVAVPFSRDKELSRLRNLKANGLFEEITVTATTK